jgi:AcrR family transcriptional regulator
VPRSLSAAEVEAFRERLCDVAEQMFAEHGPEDVTLRQLASELGVSPMTPYRYFKDKDAILAAVRARAFARFSAAMRSPSANPLTRGFRAGGDAYFRFALENPAAYRLMFDLHQPTAAQYPELMAAAAQARETMGGWLRELAAQGRFSGDVELYAHAFWSVMHGAVMLELSGHLASPLDARAVARPALSALLKEIGLWSTEPG